MILSYEIPDNKVDDVVNALLWIWPRPLGHDNDAKWAKEALRRFIVEQVNRHKVYLAKEAVNIPVDDSVVTSEAEPAPPGPDDI